MGEERGPTRGCSAAYPSADGTTNAGTRRYATTSRKLTTATRFGQRSFWTAAQTARATTQVTTKQPEFRLGLCGIEDGRERGSLDYWDPNTALSQAREDGTNGHTFEVIL